MKPGIRLIATLLILVAWLAVVPTRAGTATEEAVPAPSPSAATYTIELGDDHVVIVIHARDATIRNQLKVPPSLLEAMRAETSDEAKLARIIRAMQTEAARGDVGSELTLGEFYLYGIGVPRDLAAAGDLFRAGLATNPDASRNLAQLALVLSHPHEPARDIPRATDLVLELLADGYRQTIADALWVAWWILREPDPPHLERAGQIIAAVLALEPDNIHALERGADIRTQQGDHVGAWDLATRALAAPDLSLKQEARLRAIRFAAAQPAGKVQELEPEDLTLPLQAVLKKVGPVARWVGIVLAAGLVVVILGVLAFLTRRGDDRGPGLLLSASWMGLMAVGAGIAIFFPLVDLMLVLGVTLALVLGLRPEWRTRYFPLQPTPALGRLGIGLLTLLGWFAVITAVTIGYETVYEAIFDRPMDLQLVAAFLKAESLGDFIRILLVFAICIPAVEEIVFRGFLLDWARRRWSWTWSILIVSAVFGLVHGPAYALPTGFIGLVCGWLRMRRGNLWLPFLLHALNNGLGALFLSLGII